jgi:glycosyltransferase involved in cell wall biosynthesis
MGESLQSLLQQDYPDLEIIVVNDRSTDNTGAIAGKFAEKHPNVKVCTIDSLPQGWMGKPYALQSGATASTGDWILFTDADAVWGKGVLKKTIARMLDTRAEFATTIFEPIIETLGERLFLVATYNFGFIFRPPWKVGDSKAKVGFGVGQFCLFRREVFRKISGMEKLRLSIPNDMALGDAAKFHGFRCQVFWGESIFWCRWQEGLYGLIRGVEKNFFAAFKFNYGIAAILFVLMLGINGGPVVGLLLALKERNWMFLVIHTLGFAGMALFCFDYHRQLKVRWFHLALFPLSGIFLAVALIWSILFTAKNGGIRWRDTHYSKDTVLEYLKERDRWFASAWAEAQAAVREDELN